MKIVFSLKKDDEHNATGWEEDPLHIVLEDGKEVPFLDEMSEVELRTARQIAGQMGGRLWSVPSHIDRETFFVFLEKDVDVS